MSVDSSVRSATVADAAGVLAIYRPVVQETAISFEFELPGIEEFVERMMSVMRADPWLVTEDNGMITGYAYATPFRSRAAYSHTRETSVYVHPAYHRRGLGRALMQAIIDKLASRCVHRVVAGATMPNPASAALHESLGFRYVGTFHQVGRKFDTWHDVGFWELDLV